MEKVSEAKRFVWAYLIQNGHLTTGEWSYYGGDWEYPEVKGSYTQLDKNEKEFRHLVKTIGVDWNRTDFPGSSKNSAFTDTFHDSDDVESLLGDIYLLDGSCYRVGLGNDRVSMGQYIDNIRKMLKDEQMIKDIFGE